MVTLRGVNYNGHPVPSFSATKKRKRKKKKKKKIGDFISIYVFVENIKRWQLSTTRFLT